MMRRTFTGWLTGVIMQCYAYTGLTYFITHTDRYFLLRPGDALMMVMLTKSLVVYSIPTVVVIWLFGWLFGFVPMSLFTLVIISVVFFISPPILATALCELTLLRIRWDKKPPGTT